MDYITDHARLYVGLGFEPILLYTHNCSPYVIQKTRTWGFGGITKLGAYIDLPHNIVLDFFTDYVFMTAKKNCCKNRPCGYIEQIHSNLNGFMLGGGVGYAFN